MDLTNYEQDITIAREAASPEVQSIFDRSEQVLNKMLRTKTIENPLLNLPTTTYNLTKECVGILKEMEPLVAPTDNIYKLQAGKLYNIVHNIQAHWGKLYVATIAAKKELPDDVSTSKLMDILKASMLEITRLNLPTDLKNEIEANLKKVGVTNTYSNASSSPGCMVVILAVISSLTLLSMI